MMEACMPGFDDANRKIIEGLRKKRLRLLIWGPGDPGKDGTAKAKANYEKRCLIRQTLKEKFPRSDVAFSEDLRTLELIGQLKQEAVHAKAAHAIIILALSRGADLELDHFVLNYKWFREKVWLLVPQEYLAKGSLVEDEVFKLIPQGQIQGFTAEEFDRSDVAKRMSVAIATTVAFNKKDA